MLKQIQTEKNQPERNFYKYIEPILTKTGHEPCFTLQSIASYNSTTDTLVDH